ncbi:hypothetical protein PFISCL1PPCAC_14896, partial [Pristionchus fissidentatus]
RMSNPSTVSELVSAGISAIVPPIHGDSIRPDFDTDVLWKPLGQGNRVRTTSIESNESSDSRRPSMGDNPADAPAGGRTRSLSITEMIFGSPGKGGFSWGQGNLAASPSCVTKKESVTEDERFKELLKRESMILNDEGTFSRKSYMK